MNNHIRNKLVQYSSLAATFLTMSKTATAQIIYTDVSPDIILTYGIQPNSYSLDLNHDGIADFVLQDFQRPFFFTVAMIGVNGNNSFLGNYTSAYSIFEYNAFNLKSGEYISSGKGSWLHPPAQASFLGGNILAKNKFNSGNIYGHWQGGVNDGFVGLRFRVNDSVYYGWVRLAVSKHADEMTVKDFAYNSMAGAPIKAGEGIVSGIDETNKPTEFEIYPNPAKDYFIVSIPKENNHDNQLTIYDAEGKTIMQQRLTDANSEISTSLLSGGAYIAEVSNENGMVRKEFVIAR